MRRRCSREVRSAPEDTFAVKRTRRSRSALAMSHPLATRPVVLSFLRDDLERAPRLAPQGAGLPGPRAHADAAHRVFSAPAVRDPKLSASPRADPREQRLAAAPRRHLPGAIRRA